MNDDGFDDLIAVARTGSVERAIWTKEYDLLPNRSIRAEYIYSSKK